MIDFKHDVKLDTIHPNSLETMRQERNMHDTRRWCRQVGLISDIDQGEWFMKQNEDPAIRMYEIHAMKGELMGICGFTDIDHIIRRAEFSLYVFEGYRLNGVAEKGLKTLFSHGFRDLNLNLIWGETFTDNPAARIFEQIGMTKEGTRRDFYFKNGEYIDAHLYSIKESEWTY